MCSGRVDPTFVLKALALGADGVMIAGCHPGECHYIEQNYKAMRRYAMLKHTLRAAGRRAGPRRGWSGPRPPKGQQLAEAIDQLVEDVRKLGPLRLAGQLGRRRPPPRGAGRASSRNTRKRWRSCHEPGRHARAKTKGKLAIYWAASCGGCEIAILQIDAKILDVAAAFDIVLWPCIADGKVRDVEKMPDGAIDVCLFNGGIRTSEQEYMAQLLRRKSKVLVAFGSCASEGCIPGLANLNDRQAIFDTVYKEGSATVAGEPQRRPPAARDARCPRARSTCRSSTTR